MPCPRSPVPRLGVETLQTPSAVMGEKHSSLVAFGVVITESLLLSTKHGPRRGYTEGTQDPSLLAYVNTEDVKGFSECLH